MCFKNNCFWHQKDPLLTGGLVRSAHCLPRDTGLYPSMSHSQHLMVTQGLCHSSPDSLEPQLASEPGVLSWDSEQQESAEQTAKSFHENL